MSTAQETRSGGSLQLGTVQRYLFAGYFAGGAAVAFLLYQLIVRIASTGEREVPARMQNIATGVGALVAFFAVNWAWRNKKVRALAEETIDELQQVTWPTREETYNATVVVLFTGFSSAAVIFAMDQFWNWFTTRLFS